MRSLKRIYKPWCRWPLFKAFAYWGRSAIEFYENRNYELESNGELRLLQNIARFEPRVVIDAGANVGGWSLAAASIFPQARIFAFEPAPQTYEKLLANVAGETRITPLQKGLSYQEEVVPFRFYPSRSGQSSRYDFELREAPEQIHVALVTGDAFCREQGLHHIDMLKIDVEGADLDVLRGFKDMIAARRIDVIQFEYGRINIRSRALLEDFYEFLGNQGYRIGKLFPREVEFRRYNLRHENFIGPNFVAVNAAREDMIAAVGIILKRAPKI